MKDSKGKKLAMEDLDNVAGGAIVAVMLEEGETVSKEKIAEMESDGWTWAPGDGNPDSDNPWGGFVAKGEL